MKLALATSVPVLLLAACPKNAAPPAGPGSGSGTAAPPAVHAPPAIVPELACPAEGAGAAFVLELTLAGGCPPIPSDYGGEITELELDVQGDPPTVSFPNPMALSRDASEFVADGCRLGVRFTGDAGTLELAFAATDQESVTGAGRWTPTGGAACDVGITGGYDVY